MSNWPYEPTSDECSKRTAVEWVDNSGTVRKGFACWYPQMGGYVGKCVVELGDKVDDCFEAYVWHDGEFPFGDDGSTPVCLHHCAAQQFINFGQHVLDRFTKEPT